MAGWVILLCLFLVLITGGEPRKTWPTVLVWVVAFSVIGYIAGLHIGGHF